MWLSASSLRPLPKRGVKVPERLVAHDIYIIYITFGPWFWVCFKFEIEMGTQELMIWQLTDAEPDFELDPIQVHEYTVDIAKRFFLFPLWKSPACHFQPFHMEFATPCGCDHDLAQGKEVMPRSHTFIYQGLVKLPQAWGFVDSRRCNLWNQVLHGTSWYTSTNIIDLEKHRRTISILRNKSFWLTADIENAMPDPGDSQNLTPSNSQCETQGWGHLWLIDGVGNRFWRFLKLGNISRSDPEDCRRTNIS